MSSLSHYLNSSPPATPRSQPSSLPDDDLSGATSNGGPRPAESMDITPTVRRSATVNGNSSIALRQGLGDLSQYSLTLSRTLQLKPVDCELLSAFAKLPGVELKDIWTAAYLISIKDRLNVLQPSGVYEIPSTLSSKIDEWSIRYFLDPTISAYKSEEWPKKKLLRKLKARPDWGLTEAVANHKPAMRVITQEIGSRFIHHRNVTKEEIGRSFGTFDKTLQAFTGESVGIAELCERIITAVGGKSCDTVVSIPLMARVAFLRNSFALRAGCSTDGKASAGWWDEVDADLKELREKKDNNQMRITVVLRKMLDDDRANYGNTASVGDLSSYPAEAQVVADD
ncbi:uncharacterized protein EV420DRAFT_1731392 [Desarmillaria tabescens]|uniref:Uncharacterized protein n=1 Tax=Armillaria tabescens TaxID=1929756 RepID=A0AA39JC63_ARMTA|nr:uncharacterized protein EV420DRAFT_1731392 [Desarmillaria tabescens]KAK0440050.1 hypothetical protein EV420DRAFT_1731392 [Desarmillaria tabescens]